MIRKISPLNQRERERGVMAGKRAFNFSISFAVVLVCPNRLSVYLLFLILCCYLAFSSPFQCLQKFSTFWHFIRYSRNLFIGLVCIGDTEEWRGFPNSHLILSVSLSTSASTSTWGEQEEKGPLIQNQPSPSYWNEVSKLIKEDTMKSGLLFFFFFFYFYFYFYFFTRSSSKGEF